MPRDLDLTEGEVTALQEHTGIGRAESSLRGVTQALPFGQKLVAGGTAIGLKLLKALSSNPAYQNMDTSWDGQIAREREKFAQAKAEHPWYTGAGQVAGAGLSLAAPVPKFVAGPGGKFAEKASTAALNMGRYGAVHGVGQADTPGDQLKQAGVEAAINAPMGPAGELLGMGLGAVASKAAPLLKKAAGSAAIKAVGKIPKNVIKKFMTDPELADRAGQSLLDEGVVTPLASKATMNERLGGALDKAGKEVGDAYKAADSYGVTHADNMIDGLRAQMAKLPPEALPAERNALQNYIDQLTKKYPSQDGVGDEIYRPLVGGENAPIPAKATTPGKGQPVPENTQPMIPEGRTSTTEPMPSPETQTGSIPRELDPTKGLLRPADVNAHAQQLGKRINWSKVGDPGGAEVLRKARAGMKGDMFKKIGRAEEGGLPPVLDKIKGADQKYEALAQFSDALENATISEAKTPMLSWKDAMSAVAGNAMGGHPGAILGFGASKLGGRYGQQMLATGLNRMGAWAGGQAGPLARGVGQGVAAGASGAPGALSPAVEQYLIERGILPETEDYKRNKATAEALRSLE